MFYFLFGCNTFVFNSMAMFTTTLKTFFNTGLNMTSQDALLFEKPKLQNKSIYIYFIEKVKCQLNGSVQIHSEG